MAIVYDRLTVSNTNNTSAINTNFQRIEEAMTEALGTGGRTPNSMNADIDLNSNDLLNVQSADINSLTATNAVIASLDATLIDVDTFKIQGRSVSTSDLVVGGIQSVVAGTNVTIDNTNPEAPIINASGGGGGVTDGDKGDITVSGSGTVWTVDNGLAATKIADGTVTSVEFQYINTLTSNAQTQIDAKAPTASPTFTGTVTIPTPFTLGAISVLPTGTELNFVDGVTSNIQTQLDGKQPLDADLTSWAAVTRAAGVDTFITTPTSANLRALLTDEVGTGAAYFVGGALDTPASVTLTNGTGLPVSGITPSTVTALGVGSIELGHASDTTLARVSAGTISVEGVNVVTTSSTDTLTNKTFDANGTGNSITNIEVADLAGSAVITAAEGIGANNVDTALTTSAAVKVYVDAAVASGVADGDKGDITVSGGGTVWTVDANAITNAKLRQSAGLSLVGRSANTTGDVADITGTDGQVARVSGTVLGFGTVATAGIADDAVTNVKLGNMAANTIKGRITASTGDPEDLTATQAKTILAITQADVSGLTTASSPQFTAIELGAATDTTLSRGAAGFIDVEGKRVPSPASQVSGDTLYRGATEWERLAKGTAGQVLTMNAGATAPEWAAAAGGGGITVLTDQATTSGTTKDFTIPAGARRVTILLNGVSTNGTLEPGIQLGDSGGIETTGYVNTLAELTNADSSVAVSSHTDHFALFNSVAANTHSGQVILSRLGVTNTWMITGSVSDNSVSIYITAGAKTLSAELTTVRLTGDGDTFDAGSVGCFWE